MRDDIIVRFVRDGALNAGQYFNFVFISALTQLI